MIRYLWLCLLLIAASVTHAQKTAEDYFVEAGGDGGELYNDSAALNGYSYLVKHYPSSKFCPKAYYYIGTIYAKQGKDRLAINAYRSAFFDKHNMPGVYGFYSEGDVMPMSVAQLADLYEKTGNYDSALYFLYLGDTSFRVFHSCGTGLEFEWRRKQVRYADLYLKLKQLKKAEEILLSALEFKQFEYEADPPVPLKLKEVFRKYEPIDTLKSQMDSAVNNYFIDTTYGNGINQPDTLVFCNFNFLGIKIRYVYRLMFTGGNSWDDSTPMPALLDREKMIALLKTSDLYHLVKGL